MIPVLFAFFAWGSWAFYINSKGGDLSQGFISALTQGLFSGAMTYYLSLSVLFIYKRTQHLKHWWLWPALGTVGHTGMPLILFHTLNHTPHVALTVSLPLSVSAAYCLFLTKKHGVS